MTEENQAQENIMEITKHKQLNTSCKDLGLGIDWIDYKHARIYNYVIVFIIYFSYS